jgi:hypothetical protein
MQGGGGGNSAGSAALCCWLALLWACASGWYESRGARGDARKQLGSRTRGARCGAATAAATPPHPPNYQS